MLHISKIKAACGRIAVANGAGKVLSIGTGYLIRPDRIATCEHVVNLRDGQSITITFNDKPDPVPAKLLRFNAQTDCAVLGLEHPMPNGRSLNLGGDCEWKASWNSYGFPSLAKGSGLTMSGLVSDPDAIDDCSVGVLELTSEEAGAGMAAPLHGFSGSPVVVGDVVVGHLKRYLADPSNPLSAAWGKVYATRSECVWNLLGDDGPLNRPSPVLPPLPGSAQHGLHMHNVRELLEKSSQDGVPHAHIAFVAAESLIQIGEPVEALNVLTTAPPAVRNDQLRALALAKIGIPETLDASMRILKDLRNAGQFDPETGGLLAGRYKQAWQRSRKLIHLRKSHDIYSETFQITQDPYPGINAAATALWLNKKSASERIAHRVLSMLDGVTLDAIDPWVLATKGEALMLTGNATQAKEWYARALKRCNYAKGTVQIMQKQAESNLDALGLDANAFSDVFKLK